METLKRNQVQSKETPHDQHDRKRRCTESSRAACSKVDPLGLPGVVVDNILQHLDDRNLLTMREVCKSWNDQITSRNALWNQRCEHKRQFCFDEKTKDKFQEYLSFHGIYHRMQKGQAFQIEEHSKALDCYLTGREIISEEWDPHFLASFENKEVISILDSFKAVVGLPDNRLMMVDLETQQVLWQMDIGGLNLMCSKQSNPYIICLTDAGNLVLISLEGERRPEIDCQGKLKRLISKALVESEYDIHPSGRFILFGGYTWTGPQIGRVVYLVDVEKQTAKQLQLKRPDHVQEELELNLILNLGFLSGNSLSEDQLAVGVVSDNLMVAAVIDTQGKVIHQTCMKRENRIINKWCEKPFSGSQDLCFVKKAGKHLEKYRMCCEASQVQFKLDWRKPLHQFYSRCQSMIFGDQFVLGRCDYSMQIFRLDSGQLVAELPNVFLSGCTWREFPGHLSPSFQNQAPETLYHVFSNWMSCCHHLVCIWGVQFCNLQWLNGLSAANTKPDVPILIYRARNRDFCCVRWRDDVWMRLGGDFTKQER